jgi:ABC-type oligopeptide transport system substrate-binding subunit
MISPKKRGKMSDDRKYHEFDITMRVKVPVPMTVNQAIFMFDLFITNQQKSENKIVKIEAVDEGEE